MTFEELVAELDDGDNVSTARAILTRLHVSKTAAEVLLPVVTNGVLNRRRQAVRTVEYQASLAGGITSAHGRSLLTGQTFACGDGTYPTWGEATVEQHRMRISMQLAKINGLNVDIKEHEAAIAKILAHGVTCLDEVDQIEAAAA